MPPTQLIRSAPDAWRWLSLPQTPPPGTSTSLLVKRGFHLLVPEQVPFASVVAGQLGRLYKLESPNAPAQLWVHSQDLTWAHVHPVALGVRVPEAVLRLFPVGTLDLMTRRPPPTLGEVALIAEDDGWRALSSTQLEAEDQELHQRFAGRLRVLWSAPGEAEQEDLLWICRIDGGYDLLRHFWLTELGKFPNTFLNRLPTVFRQQKAPKQHLQQVQAQLHLLDQIHRAAQVPQPPVTEAEREKQWADLRLMAQALAAAYARIGRPTQQVIERPYAVSASLPLVLPAATSEESNGSDQTLLIPGDAVSRALLWALRDRRRFQVDIARDTISCELPLSPERGGWLAVTLPTPNQAVLGEHLLVSWLALVSLLLQRRPKDFTSPIEVTSKDILMQSRFALSGGVFKPKQYRKLFQEVEALAQMRVCISASRLSNTHLTPIFSPLLHVMLAEEAPGKQKIAALALGNWVRLIPGFPTQTCTLPAALLKLPSYAFRLGLELTLAFASAASGIDIALGTLLDRAGIAKEKLDNPQDSLEWIEKAFEQLAKAHIIADVRYPSLVPESTVSYRYRWLGEEAKIRQAQQAIAGRWRGSGWWELLLAQKVHFDNPRTSLDAGTSRQLQVNARLKTSG